MDTSTNKQQQQQRRVFQHQSSDTNNDDDDNDDNDGDGTEENASKIAVEDASFESCDHNTENDLFKICVKRVGKLFSADDGSSNNDYQLQLDGTTSSVQDLKQAIFQRSGVPPVRQRVIFFGYMLDDNDKTLEDIKMQPKVVNYVHLSPLPEGVQPSVRSKPSNQHQRFPSSAFATHQAHSMHQFDSPLDSTTLTSATALPGLSVPAQLARARRLGILARERRRHLRRWQVAPYSMNHHAGLADDLEEEEEEEDEQADLAHPLPEAATSSSTAAAPRRRSAVGQRGGNTSFLPAPRVVRDNLPNPLPFWAPPPLSRPVYHPYPSPPPLIFSPSPFPPSLYQHSHYHPLSVATFGPLMMPPPAVTSAMDLAVPARGGLPSRGDNNRDRQLLGGRLDTFNQGHRSDEGITSTIRGRGGADARRPATTAGDVFAGRRPAMDREENQNEDNTAPPQQPPPTREGGQRRSRRSQDQIHSTLMQQTRRSAARLLPVVAEFQSQLESLCHLPAGQLGDGNVDEDDDDEVLVQQSLACLHQTMQRTSRLQSSLEMLHERQQERHGDAIDPSSLPAPPWSSPTTAPEPLRVQSTIATASTTWSPPPAYF